MNLTLYITDADGVPMPEPNQDLMAWARFMGDWEHKYLKCDTLGRATIQTIFRGQDTRMQPDGEPMLFETMVYGGKLHREMQEYATRADAVRGHEAMVKRVESGT